MPHITTNGLRIYVERHGAEDAEPLLLIAGLGMQLTRWGQGFIDKLTARGFHVVTMDNRDIGLSAGFEAAGLPNMRKTVARRLLGLASAAPYSLRDMADDAAGAIEALGLGKAHLVGFSMGGMIAQEAAIRRPDLALSLTSVMSTTGRLTLPQARPEAQAALSAKRPDPRVDLDGFLDAAMRTAAIIGSRRWPPDLEEVRARARADFERAYRPDGFQRQYAAIVATPSRHRALRRLRLPATVIHGVEDPLIRVECGRATAAAIPGAELLEIEGMGHDLPEPVWDRVADAVARTAARTARQAAAA